MESNGIAAFCPTCGKAYTFYADRALPASAPRDGSRMERPCFACSVRSSRWDALWIPAFLLVVMSFPLLWMIWSNLIGPVVLLSPVALALWRRVRPTPARSHARVEAVPRTE